MRAERRGFTLTDQRHAALHVRGQHVAGHLEQIVDGLGERCRTGDSSGDLFQRRHDLDEMRLPVDIHAVILSKEFGLLTQAARATKPGLTRP